MNGISLKEIMQLLNLLKIKDSKTSSVKRLPVRSPLKAEKHMCHASGYNKTKKSLIENISENSGSRVKQRKCNFGLVKKFTNKMKSQSKNSKTAKKEKSIFALSATKVPKDEEIVSGIEKDNTYKKTISKAHKRQKLLDDKQNDSVIKLRDLKVLIRPLSPHKMKLQGAENKLHVSPYEVKTQGVKSKKLAVVTKDLKICINPTALRKMKIVDKLQNSTNSSSVLLEHNQTYRKNGRSTPLINRLRQQEKKVYLELSKDTTINETVDVEPVNNIFSKPKVPIYKQIILDGHKSEKDDPYELDISSDPDKPQKPVKRKKNYKKKSRTVKSKFIKNKETLNKASSKKYEMNIQHVLKRVMKNNNIPVLKSKETMNKILTNNVNENTNKALSKQQSSDQKINRSINIEINKDIENINEKSKLLVTQHKDDTVRENSPNMFQGDCQSPNRFQTDATSNVFQNNSPSPDMFRSECFSPDIHGNDLNDKYFGFDDDDVQTRPLINVIGNVLLNDLSECEIYKQNQSTLISPKSRLPVKNKSTILSKSSLSEECITVPDVNKMPWRSPALHNQHYLLIYKKDSLPCLEQESILDHQLVKKIEDRCLINKSNCNSKVEKSKFASQTSLLDYVGTSRDIEVDQENVNENCLSLFNYEEFIIRRSKPNIAVRKVLGLLQENNQIESTPIKSNQNDICPDISAIPSTSYSNSKDMAEMHKSTLINIDNTCSTSETYFGFESSQVNETPILSNKDRPFRVNTEEIKRYKKCVRKEVVVEKLSDELPSVLEQGFGESHTNENDNQLFNDVEPELLVLENEPITYCKKRRPRKRLLSSMEYPEEKTKRKKNEMTKAEKEAFDKWASQFNAMCAEIEQHELLID